MQEPDDIAANLNIQLTAADVAMLRNGQVPLSIMRELPVIPKPGTRLRYKSNGDTYIVLDTRKSKPFLNGYTDQLQRDNNIVMFHLKTASITWTSHEDLQNMELDTPF